MKNNLKNIIDFFPFPFILITNRYINIYLYLWKIIVFIILFYEQNKSDVTWKTTWKNSKSYK